MTMNSSLRAYSRERKKKSRICLESKRGREGSSCPLSLHLSGDQLCRSLLRGRISGYRVDIAVTGAQTECNI